MSDQDHIPTLGVDDARTNAGRAVLAKWLAEQSAALVNAARDVVEPSLAPGERITGTLPDGTPIGSVTIGKPAQTASVTDARALLAWVKEHAPTELVVSVNPAYIDQLKKTCKKDGMAHTPTGEVVPGIELVTGSASYRPTVDPVQEPLIRRRLAELIANGLLELPGPEEAAS